MTKARFFYHVLPTYGFLVLVGACFGAIVLRGMGVI